MSDQDFMTDLTVDDVIDTNPRPLLNRFRTLDFFLNRSSARLSKINDALQGGPPIEPESRAVVQSIRSFALNIVSLSDTILARGGASF